MFINIKSHVLNPFNTQLWKEDHKHSCLFWRRITWLWERNSEMEKVFLRKLMVFYIAKTSLAKTSRHRLEARIVITSREINLKLRVAPSRLPINLTLCSLELSHINRNRTKKLTWKTSLLTCIPGLEWLSYLLQLLWLSLLKRFSLSPSFLFLKI